MRTILSKPLIGFCFCLLFVTPGIWAEGPFEAFLKSVDAHQVITTSRLTEAIRGVHLAQPSWLERQGLINQDAEASYNNWINTIILKPEYTISNGLGYRMKTWEELQQDRSINPSQLAAVTFHELSHAEYEKFKKSPHLEDQRLGKILQEDLVRFLRNQNVGYFKSMRAASEYFAYFREDVFRFLSSEIEGVLRSNGIAPGLGSCLGGLGIKRRWEKIPPELHGQFQLFESDAVYSETSIEPTAIVGGETIPLDAKTEPLRSIHHAVWVHVLSEFKIPASRHELIQRMNSSKSDVYQKQLAHCNQSEGLSGR